jgi:DNA repair protein RadC
MQAPAVTIKQWAEDDRPREKLLSKSPGSLSNAELLAILIHTGSRSRTAVELAREILGMGADNLLRLGKLSVHDFMKIKGIGKAKAITIAAALELGRRRQASMPVEKPLLRNSREVAAWLQAAFQDHHHEVFAVIFLNGAGRIGHFEVFSQGGITGTLVDIRLVLKKALELEAVSILLCHNHPSGNLQPSRADEELTRRVGDAARLLDIKLLDHIIVSEEGHFSFADQGLLCSPRHPQSSGPPDPFVGPLC